MCAMRAGNQLQTIVHFCYLAALIKVSFDLAVIRLIFVVGEWLVEIGQFDSFFSSNGYKIYDFFFDERVLQLENSNRNVATVNTVN